MAKKQKIVMLEKIYHTYSRHRELDGDEYADRVGTLNK